jgi:hypothetical protein
MKPIRQTEKGGRVASRGLRYQKQFVAGKCIQMLADDSIAAIYCDFGEDCVVQKGDGAREFYQVKSKDEGGGGYRLSDICKAPAKKKKSILEKLYESYALNHINDSASFLVSNKDAEDDLLRLKLLADNAAREAGDETELAVLFEKIEKQVKPGDPKKFLKFLHGLRIKTNAPDLGEIGLHNKMAIARFIEERHKMKLSDRDLDIIYSGILDLIDSKSSNSLSTLPDDARIVREDILNCVTFTPFEKILVAGYTKDQINAMDHSQLEVKLDLAKFDGVFIDYSKKLRFGAKLKIKEFKRLPSVGKLCDEIELKVEGICAEKLQRFKLGQYANVMDLYDEIKAAFKAIIDAHGTHLGLTEEFLLGIMFDVTGRCGMRWVRA